MTVRSLVAILLATALVSGCSSIGQSRFNPLNWFGSEEEALDPIEVENERRPLVSQITSLQVERTPGGAIVRATALPPSQGWFAPELVGLNPYGDPIEGVLSYSFRAVPPEQPIRVSTPQSRELSAAVFIPNPVLDRVRVIQVTGAQNSRIARR